MYYAYRILNNDVGTSTTCQVPNTYCKARDCQRRGRSARSRCHQLRQTKPISCVFGLTMRVARRNKANRSQWAPPGANTGLRCARPCKTNPIFAVFGLNLRVERKNKANSAGRTGGDSRLRIGEWQTFVGAGPCACPGNHRGLPLRGRGAPRTIVPARISGAAERTLTDRKCRREHGIEGISPSFIFVNPNQPNVHGGRYS